MDLRSGKLPKGFVLAKPIAQEGFDESAIYGLERQNRLVITRKRDGWKMFAVIDPKGSVRLFTDGLNEIDSRLDHIKEELKSLKLPLGVLVGEAIVDLEGSDDVTKVISIFHSKTEKSIEFQRTNGMARFMIFETILPNRKVQLTYQETLLDIGNKFYTEPSDLVSSDSSHVIRVPVLDMSFDKAKTTVLEKGWEGLVLYDKEYRITYRTDGKAPKRPEGCYKWKPIMEDDFIVRRWISRKDALNVVKDLVLLQIDPVTGKEFYCGRLGSFSNDMRNKLAKIQYPLVVQAKFEMRFPKTGKIRNARFMRIRDDKPVDACVAPKTYPEQETGESHQ